LKRIAVSTIHLLVLLFLLAVPAYAEDISSVTAVVNSDKLVTINGKIDGGAGKVVNILVSDPKGSVDYLNTCLSGPGGLFSVSYTMTNTATGRYTVTVSAAGVTNAVSTSFLFDHNSIEASAVLEGGSVKVAGTSGKGAGRLITVRIIAPDGTIEYAGYTMSGAGGGFKLSYKLANTQTGKYTVYVGAPGTGTPAVCYFLAGVKTEVKAGIDKQKLVTVDAVTSVPERPVSVRITDPNGKTEYLTGILTRKDGTFSISYAMENTAKGRYTVSVSAKGFDTPAVTEFFYGTGLVSLKISSGSFTPAFASEVLNYSATVDNPTGSVSVAPTAVNPASMILVNGSKVSSGSASNAISLSEGKNTIAVAVTEPDGTLTTYTVSVTRKAAEPVLSANSKLRSLTLTGASLNESFSASNLSYTANVPNSTASLTVKPATEDSSSTVKVNGKEVKSGQASQSIALNAGYNTISITVTAQAGNTQTYTITVKRAYNASLSGLQLSSGTLNPVFSQNTTSYTASVPNNVSSITVTPQAAEAAAVIKVNNTVVSSGSASQSISLNTGANTITVTVTAPDNTSKTYTITITRAISSNANLSNITLSTGTLSPAFAANVTAYTMSVPHNVTSISATPVLADNAATVVANGGTNLTVGSNTITITVTAQDGITVKTYTITANRAPSSNANLSGITLSTGTLSPAFAANVTAYTMSVPNTVTSLTVTPVLADNTATVTVAGGSNLTIGDNSITITVTAQDGITVNTYTITVTRLEEAPSYYVRVDGNFSYGNKITADKETAHAGEIVNLTIEPAEGYQMLEGTLRYLVATIDGTEWYLITGTSFIMPAADVMVTAVFEEIQ